MKRIGNLYDSVVSLENLYLADNRARQGKLTSPGVLIHDKNREANLLSLHEQLKNGTFRTSAYETFIIHEPKERVIYRLPYFPDRIVHHAIMNVMEPIWVASFTKHTYSCIKKRGIHKCAKDLRLALKRDPDGTKYCLKIDVRKFYPSINHDILKSIIRRKVKDARLLALLDEIIDSADGVPIGNYLSQYFANLYLSGFDHWLTEQKRVKHYFRYADDIVILSDSKEKLHALLIEIRAYLWNNLRLRIKANWQIFPVDSRGINYVGFVFFHTHTLLRKNIKQALCRRVAQLNHYDKPPNRKKYMKKIASWWGWCKYSDSRNFVKTIQKQIPYEIKFVRA